MTLFFPRVCARLVLLSFLFALFAQGLLAAETNLVRNPGFDERNPAGAPTAWKFEHWNAQSGVSGKVGDDGAALIDAPAGDDSRFSQVLAVKPDTWYRFSARIRTENTAFGKVGANLSVLDSMAHSPEVQGTQDWQKVEVWGKTGPKQDSITLALRLGFYGSESSGRAWFDDVVVQPVAAAPAGAATMNLLPPPPPPFQLKLPSSIPVVLAVLGYLALAFWLLRQREQLATRFAAFPRDAAGKFDHDAALILFGALAIKLVFAAYYRGYGVDVGTFSAWALDVYRHGPAGFYRPGYFADYPPAYLYVLWLVGGISNWLGVSPGSGGFLALLKFPAILADIGSAWLLLHLFRQKPALALMAAVLWLLSPLASYNSSFWGQVDSVFTLIMLLALSQIESRRGNTAAALYALAILIKPQALLLGPVALVGLWHLPDWRARLQACLVWLAVAVALVLPFAIRQSPGWIFSLYASTLGSYHYLTVNAFNLYALLGCNWLPAETPFLGIAAIKWAWALTSLAMALIMWILLRGRGAGRYYFAAFATYMAFFVLGPKMHERYLFPAAFMGLAVFASSGDRRMLQVSVAIGLTTFLNAWLTLDIMQSTNSSLVPHGHPLMIACALANVAALIVALHAGYRLYLRGKPCELAAVAPVVAEPTTAKRGKKAGKSAGKTEAVVMPDVLPAVDRYSWIALVLICVLYAAVAFTGLGSRSGPQRFWEPAVGEQPAVFDLGDKVAVASLQYHHGLGKGGFALDWSTDGQTWQPGKGIVVDNAFAELRWRTLDQAVDARYLRIYPSTGQLQLNELSVLDQAQRRIPAKLVGGPAAAAALFDEPDTVVEHSTAYNGMYFDEVYHARSAWEILQNRDATENTHPPLGKIIIAAGVKTFGMNAFGYRAPGTLLGVLMLPIMFGLARRLLRSNQFALVATALFALDFMHFTQTRIATIDTSGVFFIMLATYWMLRFSQSRLGTAENTRALFFSGIAFGLGAASKWIVLYAGLGLAVLYFWKLAREVSGGEKGVGRQLLLATLAFVAIPLLIYVAAYIPFMLATGQGLDGVLANQHSMWSYHSAMKDTHPFSSFWYQWPGMVKPMWYYGGSSWTGPDMVSTIVAFGNPVVWYLGSAAALYAVFMLLRDKLQNGAGYLRRHSAIAFILICLAAQYLPWAIIPRKLVFIYHFFASVPFITLALVWALQQLWAQEKNGKYWVWGLVVVATLVFILFWPVISGYPVSRAWAELAKLLFPKIYF